VTIGPLAARRWSTADLSVGRGSGQTNASDAVGCGRNGDEQVRLRSSHRMFCFNQHHRRHNSQSARVGGRGQSPKAAPGITETTDLRTPAAWSPAKIRHVALDRSSMPSPRRRRRTAAPWPALYAIENVVCFRIRDGKSARCSPGGRSIEIPTPLPGSNAPAGTARQIPIRYVPS